MASMKEVVSAAEGRRESLKQLLNFGFTRKQIGESLNISRQRVDQILNPEPNRIRNRRRAANLTSEQREKNRVHWRAWYKKNGRPDRKRAKEEE